MRKFLPKKELQAAEALLEKLFTQIDGIKFAFLFGSALTEQNPSDIDIAVMFDDDSFSLDGWIKLATQIELQLLPIIHREADCGALNNASLPLKYAASKGKLIYARTNEVYDWISLVHRMYYDRMHFYQNYIFGES